MSTSTAAPLTADRKSSIRRINFGVRPLAAGVKAWKNGMVSCWGAGSVSPGFYGPSGSSGSVSTESAPLGRFYETVDNSLGVAGAKSANVQFFRQRNLFLVDNDATNPLTVANREQMVPLLDDHTATAQNFPVPSSDLGVMYDLDSTYTTNGSVWVEMAYPSSIKSDDDDAAPGGAAVVARCVITALPGACTSGSTGSGTLTGNANGAIAAQGGVTPGAGDLVFVPMGASHIPAAIDEATYLVVQPGSASTPFILTRPPTFAQGAVFGPGYRVSIGGEDTVWGGTVWQSYAAKGSVVGTTDPAMYPDEVTLQTTLVTGGGNVAITTVPLRSATRSIAVAEYAGSGTPAATTLSYQQGAITPGRMGSGSVTIQASKAQMVAVTGDTSVVNVKISNR